MKRAMAVPRGRISLPREIRRKGEDKVVVFAEGKAADDAKDAGADIVGGLELVDSVCISLYFPFPRR
jgi:large subunit ribosomal protein L1